MGAADGGRVSGNGMETGRQCARRAVCTRLAAVVWAAAFALSFRDLWAMPQVPPESTEGGAEVAAFLLWQGAALVAAGTAAQCGRGRGLAARGPLAVSVSLAVVLGTMAVLVLITH